LVEPGINFPTLERAAHVVQLALTPVFLLSGVAALLNVFAARLGRVADQTDRLAGEPGSPARDRRLRVLRLRSTCLDWAVVLAALAGAATCGAVLTLFLGAFRITAAAGTATLACFGAAILLTTFALAAFVMEMLMAAYGIRRLVDRSVRRGEYSAD
jgi:hypothetical protein